MAENMNEEFAALVAVVRALVETHPDKARLKSTMAGLLANAAVHAAAQKTPHSMRLARTPAMQAWLDLMD